MTVGHMTLQTCFVGLFEYTFWCSSLPLHLILHPPKTTEIIKKHKIAPVPRYISGIVREDERVNDPSKMSQLVNGLCSIEQIE